MDVALGLARLLLTFVFGLAGAAKLFNRSEVRNVIRDFGVPGRLANVLGTFLPVAELSIAAGMLPMMSVWWGAMGALALLSLFIVIGSWNLLHGRAPQCRCFGQLHSARLSWMTVVRNGIIMVPAGLLVWHESAGTGRTAGVMLTAISAGQ